MIVQCCRCYKWKGIEKMLVVWLNGQIIGYMCKNCQEENRR